VCFRPLNSARAKMSIHRLQLEYDVGEKIGSGSYGIVVKARSKMTGEIVAIKIIKRTMLTNEILLEREIQVMKSITHPNIIRLIDVFDDSSTVCIVMELINGGDLFDKIQERQHFSEQDASSVIRQILEAVRYLHDHNIAHRDLKVDNILCSNENHDFHIYVADFGLSRFFSDDAMMISRVGSVEYAAPEILLGQPYSKACDLWSIGVVTYILLTGMFPFSDPSPTVLMEKITHCIYKWEDNLEISDTVRDFVAHLLYTDPNRRVTAEQALEHPWIKGDNVSKLHRATSFKKLLSLKDILHKNRGANNK